MWSGTVPLCGTNKKTNRLGLRIIRYENKIRHGGGGIFETKSILQNIK